MTDEHQFGRGPEAGDWWEWDPTIRRLHIGLPLAGKSVTQVRALWASWGWDEAQLTADVYADGRASASGPLAIDAVTQSLAVVTYSVAGPFPTDPHTNDLWGPCRQYTSAPPTHLMLDVASAAGTTAYETFTWDSGEEFAQHPYLPLGASQQMFTQNTATGPEPGAAGTSYCGTTGTGGGSGGSAAIACVPGTVYRVSAYSQGYGESWPCLDHGLVNWSWGVLWYDSSSALLQTSIVASYEAQSQDGPFKGPDTADIEAPAGAAYFRLSANVSALGCQPGATKLDQITISTVDATTPTPSSRGGGGGVKQPRRTRKLVCAGTNMVDQDGTVVWDATEPLPPWPPTE